MVFVQGHTLISVSGCEVFEFPRLRDMGRSLVFMRFHESRGEDEDDRRWLAPHVMSESQTKAPSYAPLTVKNFWDAVGCWFWGFQDLRSQWSCRGLPPSP